MINEILVQILIKIKWWINKNRRKFLDMERREWIYWNDWLYSHVERDLGQFDSHIPYITNKYILCLISNVFAALVESISRFGNELVLIFQIYPCRLIPQNIKLMWFWKSYAMLRSQSLAYYTCRPATVNENVFCFIGYDYSISKIYNVKEIRCFIL